MDANDKDKNQVDQQESSEEVVPKNVLDQFKKDMFKYKSQAREFQSELEQLKAARESEHEERLKEQEKWKDLYQTAKQKLETVAQERDSERQKFIDSHKKNSVISALGGLKKPDYAKFIDVSKVSLTDDGQIDSESLQVEAERIKREFPELLKGQSQVVPESGHPRGIAQKSLSEMSEDEKNEARRLALSKKS